MTQVEERLRSLSRKNGSPRGLLHARHVAVVPAQSKRTAARSALRGVIETFFPRSPGDALAALIDDSAKRLSDDDLDRLEQAIKKARKQGK